MPDTYDPTTFKDIQERCQDLEANYQQRNQFDDEVENAYLMSWSAGADNDAVKTTVSPMARNKALGAIRLMVASDPVFSIPFDKNDQDAQKKSSLLEKAAAAMWDASGRVKNNPIHYDAVTSAILFGEMHMAITDTADLVAHAKGGTKAAQVMAERVSQLTPYLYEVYDPRTGYPEYGKLGMSAYYHRADTTAGDVLDQWGQAATTLLGADTKRNATVSYCDYWDYQTHAVWIDGRSGVLLMEDHGLPVIPIVAQVVEGSNLFNKPEKQIQPFLYTLLKSQLWERQNMSLSVIYSLIYALGNNPLFVFKTTSEDREPDVDFSRPGGWIRLLAGEDFGSLAKQVLDPSIMTGLDITKSYGEESTMYEQAMGQPLSGNAPYSTVALLNQAGRLPLTTTQRRGGWGIGSVMEATFELIRAGGTARNIKTSRGEQLSIKSSDIPKSVLVDCKLDVSLPQDDRQNATLAVQLTGGDNPLASYRWARENLLQMGQSDDMQKEIWNERVVNAMLQQMAMQQMQQMQQQQQNTAQTGQGQTMPGQTIQPGQQGQMPGMNMPGQAQGQGMPANGQTAQQQQQLAALRQLQQTQQGMPMAAPQTPGGTPPEVGGNPNGA